MNQNTYWYIYFAGIVILISFWIGVIYVAWHFISKWW